MSTLAFSPALAQPWRRPLHLRMTKDWTPAEIRALRARLGWNQTRFAKALGYNQQSSVSALETEDENGEPNRRPSGPVKVILQILDDHGRIPAPPADPPAA